MGAVSFVGDFLVVACVLVGSFFYSAFYGILRHIRSLCVLHEGAETGIGSGVGTAGFGGYGDFLTYAGKCTRNVTPAFEFACFAVFKCSSHGVSYN